MEMTDDHRLLLPLMATALLANGVSRMLCRQPIYQAMSKDFLSAIREKAEAQRDAKELSVDGVKKRDERTY